MSIFAIVAGAAAFGLTDAVVCHVMNSWQAGFLPGVVAGIWAGWPLSHSNTAKRELYLHPAPRIYKANVEDAFSKIRDVLRETSFNYGDKWRAVTSDNAVMRIVAELTYQEEEVHYDIDARNVMRERKEHVKRYIKLECQLKSQGGQAVVQYDFFPRTEGFNSTACDALIDHTLSTIEQNLGKGEALKVLPLRALGAPPKWMLILTVVSLVFLANDAFHVILQ
ncbi:MAG TPA: hypothetical protein V6C97_26910 [Oculatellaceae cyanobacterium]